MRNCPFHALCAMIVALSLARPAAAGRCAGPSSVTPVKGAPGTFRIVTRHGASFAYSPPPPREGVTATYLIYAEDHFWQSKPHPDTVPDTLAVPVGATVRWQLVSGIHTLTDGDGLDDPAYGTHFDYLIGNQAGMRTTFDSTFTSPTELHYFCQFHEPGMRGVLIVSSALQAPAATAAQRAGFSRPPSPNPTRDAISFAVSVAHGERVSVTVLDLAGRRVAELYSGVMNPGEHALCWDGRAASGARAPAGVYLVRLRGESVFESRRVTLVR